MKKITDEMIMDLADGNLNNKQAKDVILFIKKSSTARKKYEAFIKTSADFGKLNSQNDSAQEIPSNIRNLINKSKASSRQKVDQKKMFLDFSLFSNFFTNFRGIRTGFGIAVASLMIGVFGTNIYYDNLSINRNELKTRSGVQLIKNDIEIYIDKNNNTIYPGEVIINNDTISIYIKSLNEGEVFLKFINQNISNPINKKIKPKIKTQIQSFKVTSPPELLIFQIVFLSDGKKQFEKSYKFIVENN